MTNPASHPASAVTDTTRDVQELTAALHVCDFLPAARRVLTAALDGHTIGIERLSLLPGEDARGIADFPDYAITSFGRIFNVITGNVLKPFADRGGYLTVSLSRGPRYCRTSRLRKVHQLVLEAFVGPRPDRQESRHLNDIPYDNRAENLAWGTHTDNLNDARKRRGLPLIRPTPPKPPIVRPYTRGERNHMSKLSESEAKEIRATYRRDSRDGFSYNALARKFGISPPAVRDIVLGRNWSYLAQAETAAREATAR